MKRNVYDLSHFSQMAYKIGRLQTLSVTPVIAGDSLTIVADNLFYLSPLRRSLTHSAVVDIAAFYVPHRHVYSNWEDFIKGGYDESQTLGSMTLPSHVNGDIGCLGQPMESGTTVPYWSVVPYNMIWNRFYRPPKFTPELQDDWDPGRAGYPTNHTSSNSPLLNTADQLKYGYAMTRLKTPWSTGINYDDLTTGDKTVNIPVGATADLDIVMLEQVKKRYGTEAELEWFQHYYKDIMKGKFGAGGVNPDADQRPTMLMRKTYDINGHDINGSGDANLGDFSGRGIGNNKFIMPRRMFNEHGSVWLVAGVRFPTILLEEQNPLHVNANPSYLELAGEAELVKTQEPKDLVLDDWCQGTSGAVAGGKIPYGQEYRYHTNIIHRDYRFLQGYPYLHFQTISSMLKAQYINSAEYDPVFSTLQLGHAQSRGRIMMLKHSSYPTQRQSIYAGVN